MGLKWQSMALVFAVRYLCGVFLYERNDSLGELGDQKLILFLVGLPLVLTWHYQIPGISKVTHSSYSTVANKLGRFLKNHLL